MTTGTKKSSLKTVVPEPQDCGVGPGSLRHRILRRFGWFVKNPEEVTPYLRFRQAVQLCNEGCHAQAVPLLQDLLKHDSERIPVRETLGQVIAHLGRNREAIKIYREIVESGSQGRRKSVLLGLAGLLSKEKNHNEAIETLNQLLEVDPSDARALAMRGQIEVVMGLYEQAVETFLKSLSIDFGDGEAKAGFLSVLSGISSREKACGYLGRYLEIVPDDKGAWVMLGRLTWEMEGKCRECAALEPADKGCKSEGEDPGQAGPLQIRKPLSLNTMLVREKDVYDEQIRHLGENITLMRLENSEWGKLLADQESRLGYLDSYKTWAFYIHTSFFMRCMSLFTHKYGKEAVYGAAVKDMPADLLPGYSMNGLIPVEHAYLNAFFPERYVDVFSNRDIDALSVIIRKYSSNAAASGIPPHPIPSGNDKENLFPNHIAAKAYQGLWNSTSEWLTRAFMRHGHAGMRVAVYGSSHPLYEAVCLVCGAIPTSVGSRRIFADTDRIKGMTVSEWEKNPVRYDAAFAISCLEHEGLGMYGDKLDPDADLKAMGMLKKMVKPGGLLFLAVPVGLDRVLFNTSRIYGRLRLPVLLEGWDEVESHGFTGELMNGNGVVQPLFVLRST